MSTLSKGFKYYFNQHLEPGNIELSKVVARCALVILLVECGDWAIHSELYGSLTHLKVAVFPWLNVQV